MVGCRTAHWRSPFSRTGSRQCTVGPFRSRLFALNVHDAVMRLVEGGCDLLIAYYPPHSLSAIPARYEMVSLGHEVLATYSSPNADGNPIFMLPGQQGQPLLSGLRRRHI